MVGFPGIQSGKAFYEGELLMAIERIKAMKMQLGRKMLERPDDVYISDIESVANQIREEAKRIDDLHVKIRESR